MFRRSSRILHSLGVSVLMVGAVALAASVADARPGSGRNVGSRGTNTFTPPPATSTAPKAAAPIERSITQPGRPAAAAPGNVARPAAAAQPSRFGGWGGLLMGGLIGAGLASMFGMGAMASVLGFLLQTALIGGLIWLAWSFFRRRMGATAAAGAGQGPANMPNARQGMEPGLSANRAATGGFGGGARTAMPATVPLTIGADDFNSFERLLSEIQLAFGRGDMEALGPRLTPEMLSYFAEQLDTNAKRGVRNEIGAPKLLQGDLAEAWTEAAGDFATVAMRYALTDATVELATGRVVEGSREMAAEITEVWTFTRPRNGNPDQWELSAIQQA